MSQELKITQTRLRGSLSLHARSDTFSMDTRISSVGPSWWVGLKLRMAIRKLRGVHKVWDEEN